MDRFTHRVAIFVGLAALIMFTVAVLRGTPLGEVFLLAVALAVSVIPEGLPVAITVALAIGMRRMAELILFILSLLTGLPLPLVAVQLLWLNLVTNGIQDVALAFEPGEGHELNHPPRQPGEAIFNRLMIERVVISALIIGAVAFLVFQWLLARGFTLDEARNGTLLLMVLFENVHVFNCRSERLSVFRHNFLSNPILLIGTIVAQLVHIGAMYTPWISDVLHIQPVSPQHWLELLALALTVLVAMELHKAVRKWLV